MWLLKDTLDFASTSSLEGDVASGSDMHRQPYGMLDE
jgi:hypothetical protein